ncbi:MAG: penicillin-binding protein 2 [Gammaproteobacteria bacterium]|jgi:penicillin-binding protein 2|nr:penicillin-binding protein 2 [Gammaproteobacteria bacterium]|tara:strand:+ start:24 stop:1841 length:1818 start_codon:yes stop_codon:yes gene_type:complete
MGRFFGVMKRSSPSNSSIFRRILIFLIPFLILLTLAFFQIFNLMIIRADEFITQADSNRILKERVFPPRGLILDRNEEIVVENFIRQDLKVTPSFVEDYSLYISNLSELMNYETSKIEDIFYKKLNEIKPFQSFTLIRNLNDEQIAKLNLNLSKFSGTEIIPNFSRNVTEGESLGSVVGYLGFASKNSILQDPNLKNFSDQQIGLLGIEKEYDDFLRGEIGYKFLEKDSKGNVIKVLSTEPPKKGKNLKLSIDLELQRTLFKEFSGKKGALIAIEPETGFIRALISSPSYDPNYFNNFYSDEIEKILQDENSPLFNRAVSGQYPPASTLKPFIGLAALEEQVITWDEKIHDQGEFFVEGDDRPYRGWKEEGHGFVNMESAIAESSDVYFYNIAFDLTVSSISPFLAKFGFGSSSKLLGNESKGILPDKKWKLGQKGEFWFKGDTINMGIGQGYILTTPLQIAIAYSALVNGGQLITPRIVESIDGVATEFSSERIELKNNENWELIKKALVSVVESNKGTAHNLFDPKKRIAGKTGTAQVKSLINDIKYQEIRENELLRDHALFVGYGPIEKPSLVVVVIVENGESGSLVAAPIVKKAINSYQGL